MAAANEAGAKKVQHLPPLRRPRARVTRAGRLTKRGPMP